MRREITGFRWDEAGDPVAVLSCGHGRHVRHDPPWNERPWVLTQRGRASQLGQPLDCLRCDVAEWPEGFEPYRRTPAFDENTLPRALQARHDTKAGVWARIHVVRGSVLYRVLAPEVRVERLAAGGTGTVVPEVPHELELTGPVELYVEFWRRPKSTDPVTIAAYDPSWPQRFEQERRALLALLEPLSPRIEHVGSTAVPGLAAKPIVDLLLGTEHLADLEPFVSTLEDAGWRYHPELADALPGRRFFARPPDPPRQVHLHAVEIGGDLWERHLRFRDALRADAELARRYEALKHELAARHRDDRETYSLAKSDFVESVLAEP